MNDLLEGLGKELKSHGLRVMKVPGWRLRGGSPFSPIAVLNHHTASSVGNVPCVGICTNGRSDLPGPLCNFLIGRDGLIVFIASGRANHAGLGGPFRGIPKDSGNSFSIGVEWENNGIGERWPEKQLKAGAILNAVLLKRLGRSSFFCFDHKEYAPTRKIDRTLDPKRFRRRVKANLKRLK